MSIKIFQVTKKGDVSPSIHAETLDAATRALPQGFYTTFSTFSYGTRVMGLRNHLQRLFEPARALKLRTPADEKTLRERIAAHVKENLPQETRARLILTRNAGEIYIIAQPFTPLPESVYTEGAHAVTSPIVRRDPRIKDTGFISESAAQRNLVNKDVFEVLLTKNGNIYEGMTSNFYVVANGGLITARRGILLGVTRRAVLRLARGAGLGIEYRAPNVNEKIAEAFITSSSRGVVPIVSIDGKPVGQGRVEKWTKTLMKDYGNYVEKTGDWIVPSGAI